jgi:restriction system protein
MRCLAYPNWQSFEEAAQLDVELRPLSVEDELLAELSRHPERMYDLSPRRFEEAVAELMSRLGYGVQLTPASKDGGRDILAIMATPAGRTLTLVECKRYAPHRKVGVEQVERFMWVVHKDRASCGLYVTTSSFTSGVQRMQKEYAWLLLLRDFSGLHEWLRQVSGETSDGGMFWTAR